MLITWAFPTLSVYVLIPGRSAMPEILSSLRASDTHSKVWQIAISCKQDIGSDIMLQSRVVMPETSFPYLKHNV